MNIPGRALYGRLGPRSRLALRLILGLGILVAVIATVDIGNLISALGGVRWSLAVPAILGLTAVHLIAVLTWKILSARMIKVNLKWGYLTRVYYSAQAAGSLTPSNIGSDVYRVYAVCKGNSDWKKAFLPIAAQRIISYLGLLLLGVAALSVAPFPPVAVITILVLSALFIIGIAAFLILARGTYSTGSLIGGLAQKMQIPSAWAAMKTGRIWNTLGITLLLTLIFHSLSVALSYILVLATGGGGEIMPILAALMLTRLIIILPLPINGLGFQEGAMAVLFSAIGIPAEIGLAVSLLSRLAFLQTVFLGVVFMLTGKVRIKNKPEPVLSTGSVRAE